MIRFNRRGAMALSQIFLLVISIVAISYILGSEIKVVSAQSEECVYSYGVPGGSKGTLGPWGVYEKQTSNPSTPEESTTPLGSGTTYYKNAKRISDSEYYGGWKKDYGAYFLAEQNGKWYFWNFDDDKWQLTPEKVDTTTYSLDDCEKAWAAGWSKQLEFVDNPNGLLDEINGQTDTTTRSEEGIKSTTEKTCADECALLGYEAGTGVCRDFPAGSSDIETYCGVNHNAIGKIDCKSGQECCCRINEKGEKDENAIANLPVNPSSIIPPYKDTRTECVKYGGTCMAVGKEIECKKEQADLKCGTAQFCCIDKNKIPSDEEKKTEEEKKNTEQDIQKYNDCIKLAKTTKEKKECEALYLGGTRAAAPYIGGRAWWNYLVGHIVEGAVWAAGVYAGIQALKTILPEEYQNLADTYAVSLAGAIFAGKSVIGIVEAINPASRAAEGEMFGSSLKWGVGIAALYFITAFRYTEYEVITFQCQPWDAPTGGSHCDDCNNQGILPCSEYQCKSLGQGCELLNKGTDDEKCAWVNRGDVEFPTIEPWEEVLSIGYNYILQDTGISPPDTGVKVVSSSSTTGCVKAFTPLTFGIELNEPAKCKLDLSRKPSYDDMDFYFSNGLLLKEHSYSLSLPGSGGEIEVENDGEYNIYVRCQDANGNYNTANFVFNFCVEQGPDTTPPLIVQTSILNGFPIAYDQTSIDLEVYVNEPVEGCKWSHLDQDYGSMENEMDCTRGNDLNDMNGQGLYTCETTLDSLKNREENNFYFRCRDTTGNVNEESYKFMLMGTQPLVLDWIKPEADTTIKDSTEAVKVTLESRTSAGYNEGKSNCYFKLSDEDESRYVLFLGDGEYSNYEHSQDLWLTEDQYTYDIKCVDLGGNYDVLSTTFNVESDQDDPLVVRAYHEESYLKIITDEAARCVYDTKYENYPCDYVFDEGTEMTPLEEINHYTEWNPELTFYIKCQDEFGVQPNPDECSIIIRPSNLY